jgi:hypothetical protein
MRERLLIIDDGPEGALEQLLAQELPDMLAVVSSKRRSNPGLRRAVWLSTAPIQQLMPRDGVVHLRLTSDLLWTPEPLCAEILEDLMPPGPGPAAMMVVATLLGLQLPVTIETTPPMESWLRARRFLRQGDLESARQAISLVNRAWPAWGPGWSLADEVHARMGLFHVALACRMRADEPPVRLAS